MPLTAPQGDISLAIDYLRSMIADSATFRTWTGTATHDAALARVHYESLPVPTDRQNYTLAELTAHRPFAMVWTGPDNGMNWDHDANGSGFEFTRAGGLGFLLEQSVAAGQEFDPPEASRLFANTVGNIVLEVLAMCGLEGYLAFESVALEVGPVRSHPDLKKSQGDFLQARFRVDWRQSAA